MTGPPETPREFLDIAPNIRLHLRDWGAGKPIVFLHGWVLSHEMWEYQFNALAERGCRCVGITLRGHGRSSQPYDQYNYDVFADDLHKVLAALGLQHVTLLGYSMGGAVALRYMARYQGEHVARLVLCGAAAPSFTQRPGFPLGVDPARIDDLILACRNDRAKLMDDFGRIVFRNLTAGNARIRAWLYQITMQASPQATIACLVALRDTDLRDDMAKVNVPTLIMHAPGDRVCPFPLAESIAAGIEGSQLIRFENSGHALFYEERDKFNAELLAFVAEIGRRFC